MQRHFCYLVKINFFLFFSFFNFFFSLKLNFAFFIILESLNDLPLYLLDINFFGAPARSRTQNLLVRSQALYPIELQALNVFLSKYMCYLKRLSEQFYAIINFFLNIFLKLIFVSTLWRPDYYN